MFHLQLFFPQALRIGILSPALLFFGSLLLRLLVLASVLVPASVAMGQSQIAQDNDAFETHIRPLLAEKCFSCHGPTKQWSGLRLDSAVALAKGETLALLSLPTNPNRAPCSIEYSRRTPSIGCHLPTRNNP